MIQQMLPPQKPLLLHIETTSEKIFSGISRSFQDIPAQKFGAGFAGSGMIYDPCDHKRNWVKIFRVIARVLVPVAIRIPLPPCRTGSLAKGTDCQEVNCPKGAREVTLGCTGLRAGSQ